MRNSNSTVSCKGFLFVKEMCHFIRKECIPDAINHIVLLSNLSIKKSFEMRPTVVSLVKAIERFKAGIVIWGVGCNPLLIIISFLYLKFDSCAILITFVIILLR